MPKCTRFLLLLAALAAADEVSDLAKGLDSAEPLERWRAADGLRKLGEKAKPALPALAELLKDAQPWVRVEAGRALVEIGITGEEVPALVARLGPSDPDTGLLVAEALAGLGPPAVPPLLELLPGKDDKARRGALAVFSLMGRHGAPATPLLLDLLKSEDPASAKLAGEALRRCGPWAKDFVPDILDRLQFGDPDVRWAAAGVLGRIGPDAREAVPALKEMRAGEDERLRAAAAEALGRIDVLGARGPQDPALMDPKLATEVAPARFRAKFETTRGVFVVEVERAWAPHGADRFFNLVKCGFFDGASFFRVLPGFVAQFGMSGSSKVNGAWAGATIPDDPPKESNAKGTIAFAKTDAKDSRTTQVFLNLSDNARLDKLGFAPFGRVVEGMEVVLRIYDGYGELAPRGKGPDPQAIASLGDSYLKGEFPRLDAIDHATIVEAPK